MPIVKNTNNKIGSGFSNYNTTIDEIIVNVEYNNSLSGLTFTKFNNTSFTIPVENKLYFSGLTYNQIKNLKDNDELLVGRTYELKFNTIHTIPNTNVNNTGTTETLILEAVSPNEFNKVVYSLEYPNDIIHFDFDDNLTENGLVNRFGRIIYRKSLTNNNEAFFDFRTLKVRLWDLSITTIPDFIPFNNYTGETIFKYFGTVFHSLFPHTSTSVPDSSKYTILTYIGTFKSFNSIGLKLTDNILIPASNTYNDYLIFDDNSSFNVSVKQNNNIKCPQIYISPTGVFDNNINNSDEIQIFNGSYFINVNDVINASFGNGSVFNNIKNSKNIICYNGGNYNEINNSNDILIIESSNQNKISNSYNLKLSYGIRSSVFENNVNLFLTNGSDRNLIKNSKDIFFNSGSYSNIIDNSNNLYIGYSIGNDILNSKNIYLAIDSTTFNYYGSCQNNQINNSKNITGQTMFNNVISSGCENIKIKAMQSSFLTPNVKNKYIDYFNNVNVLISDINKPFNIMSFNNITFSIKDFNGDIWGTRVNNLGEIGFINLT